MALSPTSCTQTGALRMRAISRLTAASTRSPPWHGLTHSAHTPSPAGLAGRVQWPGWKAGRRLQAAGRGAPAPGGGGSQCSPSGYTVTWFADSARCSAPATR